MRCHISILPVRSLTAVVITALLLLVVCFVCHFWRLSLSLSLCGFYLHICAYRYLLFISSHSFHLFSPCAFSLQHFYISTACHLMCISAASLNNSLAKWWWDILNQSIFRAYIVLSFTSFYRWNDITDITSSLHFVFMDATIFTQFGWVLFSVFMSFGGRVRLFSLSPHFLSVSDSLFLLVLYLSVKMRLNSTMPCILCIWLTNTVLFTFSVITCDMNDSNKLPSHIFYAFRWWDNLNAHKSYGKYFMYSNIDRTIFLPVCKYSY